MKTNVAFLCIVLLAIQLQAQALPVLEQPVSNWSYDGLGYADFGTQEQHAEFAVLYAFNPKIAAEVQGFYDTYRISNVFDLSQRVRWSPSRKVFLFSGMGVQIEQSKGFGKLPIMPVRIFNGIGYEPNKKITIEAIHDLNFSPSAQVGGFNATPALFTLKGKYRF